MSKSVTTPPSFPRGSEWRRWDLHVHTPASALENNYVDWDSYVDAIEKAGDGISVIGVTDYCSIEGYKTLLGYRTNGRLNTFDLLIPNIEFRTHPETPEGRAINIHLLVSPHEKDHVAEIERALGKLHLAYDNNPYACTKDELIRLGRAHDAKQTDTNGAYKSGVNQFKPDFDTLRKWYNQQGWLKANSIVVIANGKDGPGGLSKDAGFSAARQELYRFANLIFSGNPKDQKYFLGEGPDAPAEVIRKNGSLKACVHGSDAHEESKLFEPDKQRYCWIKADPTFEGLRQLVHVPKTRVYIGPTPPQASDESKIIRSIAVQNAGYWFPSPTVEFNGGLVAVIGEKGSGKTALADLLAFATNAWSGTDSSSSFINKAYAHLQDVTVDVTWGDGRKSSQTIGKVTTNLPEVRYLSQDFVEELCSQDISGKALVGEIEDVVFSHIDEAERLEASNFEELRRLKTEHITLRQDNVRAQLTKLNSEVARLEDLVASRPSKEKLLASTKTDIAAIDKQIPLLQSTVNQEVAAALAKEKEEYQKKIKERTEANLDLNRIQTALEKSKDIRETLETGIVALEKLLREIGLEEEQIANFRPTFVPNATLPLIAKQASLRLQIDNLRGDATAPTKNGTSIADIQARIVDLEKALAADENERKRLLDLQNQRIKLQGDLTRIEKEIKDIDTVHTTSLTEKREERWTIYLGYFDLLHQEAEILRDLYRPLDAVLSADSTGAKAGFAFGVQKIPDFDSWLETGRSLIDGRKDTPFRERTLAKEIEAGLSEAWKGLDKAEIRKKLGEFLERVQQKTSSIDDVLSTHATRVQFYDWLFSPDHVKLAYSLKYGGTDLSVLSPGTRGIVLLILYLEMDRQDSRPLIIDQPEGNLDGSSIYDSLVPYLQRAKHQRQIILITHNPNLVVTADADQVIVASMKKESGQAHPSITYKSGSLEDADGATSIREQVCRILEGGRQAFKAREDRYAINSIEVA